MTMIEGYRLSPQQRRVWSLLREGRSLPYCAWCSVAICGALDRPALAAAVRSAVAQHEILRTTFRRLPEMTLPLQVVGGAIAAPLAERDLRGLPPDDQAARIAALGRDLRRTPFDLEQGPLFRVLLAALAEREHRLLICASALIADAAALRNLARAIGRAYAAAQRGETPDGDPLQYADIAEWQNNLAEEDAAAVGRAYWREREAAGADPAFPLAFEREAPPGADFAPAALDVAIGPALAASIADLAQRCRSRASTVLLASWSVLLWRMAERRTPTVGVACDGRKYEDVVDALGPFARYAPIRPELDPPPAFRALLGRLDEPLDQAQAWQEYFAWEAAESPAGAPPFFALGFDFADQPGRHAFGGAEFAVREQTAWLDRFNLRLACDQSEGDLRAAIHYDAGRFAADEVARLAEALQTLIASAVAAPDLPIDALEILSDAERTRLLLDLNATATAHPGAACAHDLFADQAARTPDAVALTFGDEGRTTKDEGLDSSFVVRPSSLVHLTYGALDRRANQLARRLRRMGVGPETTVALCMERSPDLVIALLGVLKAGGAYVPIDPSYPSERIRFMLEDSGAIALVTKDEGRRTKEGADSSLVTRHLSLLDLAADWDAIAAEPADALASGATGANLAYVIYTSGSTGQPKGVMATHQGLANYLRWCFAAYPLAEGRGAPVHSPIAFDLTITSLLAPLVAGRGVLLLPEEEGAEALGAALAEQGDWSLVKLTPAHLDLLSKQIPAQRAAGRARAFIVGGESLLAESVAFWQAAAPDTLLINEYGPTEAVVGCCVYQAPPGERHAGALPIGRPIANTQLYVLDRQMRPLPTGAPGELYIGGIQLARGYLGRPDLTAAAFLPNPFVEGSGVWGLGSGVGGQSVGSDPRSPIPDPRIYRTGDRACYRADGALRFLGRMDDQVKLRGYRIEPGEVEAALRAHPSVRAAVVTLRRDPPAPRLVAYVVPTEDERRTTNDQGSVIDDALPSSLVLRPSSLAEELRPFLAARLPAHMVPAAIVELDALPLTANGKLDRRALPAPEARRAASAPYVAPSSPAEALLAQIWARLLQRPQVGVHDNFFALGGDSILAIQIIAQAREQGVFLTPKQMFQHQTIADLAAVAASAPQHEAEQGFVQGAAPLTPIQQAFLAQARPDPQHYTQALLLALRRPLATATLARALDALQAHHDALRLRFARDGDGWRQTHAAPAPVPVQILDLGALPRDRQRAALEHAAAALQRSLDLARGPILRAARFALGSGQPDRLLLIAHHLVVDTVSWQLLLDDLYRVVTQLAAGQPPEPPPKTSSFQAWATRLAAYARSPALLAEREYWTSIVRQPVPRLPRDHDTGSPTIGSAAELAGALEVDETQALLTDLAAAFHSQINDALLAALALAVAAWTGAPWLRVELEGHGREDLFDDLDLTRTVGWFTAAYPVTLDLRGASDPGSALLAVKEQLRAIPNRGVGYGVLRYLADDADLRADLATQPEISFNYLGQVEAGAASGGGEGLFGIAPESSGPSEDPATPRRYALEVSAVVAGGRLEITLRYSPERHARATVERLLDAYLAALRDLIAHGSAPDAGGFSPSDFPLAHLDQDKLNKLSALLDQIDDAEE